MEVSPTNRALAENLRYYMDKLGLTQKQLETKCGVKQTTISLYLRPEDRKPGKDGKPGSAKLVEVELLANAFGIETWEFLRPLNPRERAAYEQIEAAFLALRDRSPAPSQDTASATPSIESKSGVTRSQTSDIDS